MDNSHLYAEWTVAIGTLLLASVTFIIHLMGDSYTRLIKENASNNFKKQAFDFLETSLLPLGPQAKTPSGPTVEENIDNFYSKLMDHKMYLSCCNKCKFKKYILLAKENSEAWQQTPKNEKEIQKIMKKIANEMRKLAPQIGKTKQLKLFEDKYPEFFQ